MSENNPETSISFIDEDDDKSLLDLADQTSDKDNETLTDDVDEHSVKNNTPKNSKYAMSKKKLAMVCGGVILIGGAAWAYSSGFSVSNLLNDGNVSFFSFGEDKEKDGELISKKISAVDEQVKSLKGQIGQLSQQYIAVGNEYTRKTSGVEQSLSSQIDELKEQVSTYEAMFLSISAEFESLRNELNKKNKIELPSGYEDVLKQQVVFKKNQGWFSNRLKSLEAADKEIYKKLKDINDITSSFPTVEQTSKRLTVDVDSPWVLKGASDKVAVLFNKNTKKPLRVTIGMDVPYCGPVLTIEPETKTVVTQSCRVRK